MSIYEQHQPAGGGEGGAYLDLKDGESVKVRIASEPAIFSQEYRDEDTQAVSVTTKYAWVVWNRGEKKAQVFAKGASVFRQLAALYTDWGEPTGFDINIRREGTKLATRWIITPVPKSADLTKEEVAECEGVDLLKITRGHWLKDFDPKDHVAQDKVVDVNPDEPIDLNGIPF